MGFLCAVVEVLLGLVLVVLFGFVSAIILEAYRRKYNRTHVEAPAIFEDPSSLKKVPCCLELLTETLNYLQQRAAKDKSFSYEVLIIDDGSSDRNHGKGEAIRKGMLHSRGELLLMLDADGATKVNDLEKLESQIHAVAAFGSRAHLEEKALAARKWYRNLLMKGFHLVVLLTAGPGIRDTQCGFKMFTRAAARKLFTNIRLKRWCFDVELVYLCKRFGIPMIEISVNWSEIPGSKVNPLSIPNMLWELALMSAGYRIGIWKFCQ
ncbi:dolichyl-phosphate beta-glucosyltransferase-like [Melia azedarach]|uniref:Dolichyl-phosphate beta-glucosyltransferase-like n=1 Tax=Melia azedarach TaxID=155640 RepID=A0ACC1Y8H5_MELAZ|nr:dolichyl-phosphate beta-glucosyltransferase-like [Melia azedarach]